MTTPTRQEIIDAHYAAERLVQLAARPADYTTDERILNDYRDVILAALPPKPQPTMADMEWDDDEHYLAEAEHPIYGKVIMLFQSPNTGNIYFTYRGGGEQCHVYSPPEDLTPTGKRYTLTEVRDD